MPETTEETTATITAKTIIRNPPAKSKNIPLILTPLLSTNGNNKYLLSYASCMGSKIVLLILLINTMFNSSEQNSAIGKASHTRFTFPARESR
jgi:hypothetical protein